MPWEMAANLWIINAFTALAYVALGYWVIRFIALGRNVSAALEVNLDSARTYLPYGTVVFLFVWLSAPLAVLSGSLTTAILLRFSPLVLYFLAPWGMTAPSGSTVIGPVKSLKLVMPHVGWAIGVLVLLLLSLVLFGAGIGLIAGLLLPAPVLMSGSVSLPAALVRGVAEAVGDVSLIVATYALALRTGVRVSGPADLRAIFE
jgi:hypothetical protein